MSQKSEILQMLRAEFTVTPRTVWLTIGCMRLAARIKDLRDDGFDIHTMKHNGDGYATYTLLSKGNPNG